MKDALAVTLIWIFQPSYQHGDKKAKPKDPYLIKATRKRKKKVTSKSHSCCRFLHAIISEGSN